ncbi:MAG: rRNA m(7)G-527 methyltransferase [Candidatus Sulfotelmatobacter sp.]|nr:rRNA m(7)G-527 methyltransferase [Candidatus Sulfotelmatobacter sp.]
MEPALIAKLLQPFLRDAGEQQPFAHDALYHHISTYIDILLHWNARINLTAVRDPEEIVTRHFGESLFAARHLFPGAASAEKTSPAGSKCQPLMSNARVADLGSGAGFPGIPIKLWAPHIALTLVESNHKKATFLREVTRTLTLTDVDITHARAETLPLSSFDVVTLRAVERLVDVLATAVAVLVPAGRLALLISSSQLNAVHRTIPSFEFDDPIPVPASESRVLLIGRKPFRNSGLTDVPMGTSEQSAAKRLPSGPYET